MGQSQKVSAVVTTYPANAQKRHAELRALLMAEAERLDVGPLTETLKWGQPSYLTEVTKAGTTVRMAWSEKTPEIFQVLVHCQTSLVEEWRQTFEDALVFDGNRAVLLDLDAPVPTTEIAQCFATALTYHCR